MLTDSLASLDLIISIYSLNYKNRAAGSSHIERDTLK